MNYLKLRRSIIADDREKKPFVGLRIVAAANVVLFTVAFTILLRNTAPPRAPTGLAASPAYQTAYLSWRPNAEADVRGYEVRVRAVGDPKWSVRERVHTSSYLLENLENDLTYEIRVWSLDKAGKTSKPSQPIQIRPRTNWIVTGENIRKVHREEPEVAREVFDSPNTYALGRPDAVQNQVPHDYKSIPTVVYRSYALFQVDIRAKKIHPSIQAIAYDPEKWPDTPASEQKDPSKYFRLFSELARENGYYVILAPARNLASVAKDCQRRAEETLSQAFIRCNISGSAAEHADALVLQAQAEQGDATTYSRFVAKTARQARAANPAVVILSGLTTSPSYGPVSDTALVEARQSVRHMVAGHWFTIQGRDPAQVDIAIAALKRLE